MTYNIVPIQGYFYYISQGGFMKNNFTQDMTKGSPIKLLLQFAIPMLIGNIFQQFYNMVDSIIVGKYNGKNALAAVGTTGPLNFLIFSLVLGLASGISIVISQYYGAKDEENVKKGFATALYIIIISSILMTVVGIISSRPLLKLLQTPDTIIDDAVTYMVIVCLGILGIGMYNGVASILRAMGNTIIPLIFLIVACLLNIAFDLLFVIVFDWGVAGVAYASIISQYISAIGCTIYALRKVEILRITKKDLKLDIDIFKQCIKMGIPVALQNAFISCSTMALQGVINSYGEVIMAATTAATRIEQLILQPGMSIGVAVAFFTGQNIGAGNIDRVKEGFVSAAKIIISFSLFMLPVIYFGGEFIMRLFTKPEEVEVMRIGLEALRVPCFFYSFVGMIFITRNLLSGASDVKIPMLMGFLEVIFRVGFAVGLSRMMGYSGIFWATGFTWLLTSIVGCTRYFSGKWMDKSSYIEKSI